MERNRIRRHFPGDKVHVQARILIIDDDETLQRAWTHFLKKFQLVQAFSFQDGMARFLDSEPDIVLLDIVLPDGNGIDLLKTFKSMRPHMPVLVITGQLDMQLATTAVKNGAYDFLTKPLHPERLRLTIDRAVEMVRMNREVRALQTEKLLDSPQHSPIVAASPAMQEVLSVIESVAARQTTVLLLGASGVGKTRLARLIHQLSPRRDKPFVEVNLSTISEGILESQLFGHVKGAFTGAVRENPGLFAAAEGGTIFLDEIGDVPPAVQVKLLQVLQDRVFYPVGSTRPQAVDVRVVAATVRDLQELVRAGRFREDLFYRVSVFPVTVPPLSQRKADIPQLVHYFVHRICLKENQPAKEISPEFMQMVVEQAWPGNVRELENAVEYAITVARERPRLEVSDLQAYLRNFSVARAAEPATPEAASAPAFPLETAFSLDDHIDSIVREAIAYAIARENGNLTRAAARLGLTRRRLGLYMKRVGLSFPRTRGRPRTVLSGGKHG